MNKREVSVQDILDEYSLKHPPKNRFFRLFRNIFALETIGFVSAAVGEATGKVPIDQVARAINSLHREQLPITPRDTVGELLVFAFFAATVSVGSAVAVRRSERLRNK